MIPGTIEFRNHVIKEYPQEGGEQRAAYLRRAARHFKITHQRMHDLFYDQRTEISVDEHAKIFRAPAGHSKHNLLKKNETLQFALEKAKEKEQQRDEELARVLQGFRTVLDAVEERIAVDTL